MITLVPQQVRLSAAPTDKEQAIRQAAQLLVDNGNIDPGYINSMFEREKVANTYLANGIAIPHGVPADRDLIHETGIAVLQAPGGVEWKPGQTAHLIVAIAAKSDEHITVLRRLTRVLGDTALVDRLTHTADPADIIEALTGERPAPAQPAVPDFAHGFDIVVPNAHGLHARPATNFVDLAKAFAAAVRVRYGTETADGKSMLSLLQLGVSGGATVHVSAEGPDADAALAALRDAIAAGLGDEEEDGVESAEITGSHDWSPSRVQATIDGIAASNGLAIGRVRQHQRRAIVVDDTPGDKMTEADNLQAALDAARGELDTIYEEMKARLGSGKAAIFRAHAEFLNDANLVQETVRAVFQGHSAAYAWQQAVNERVSHMQKLDDPVLAGRAVDLSDVGQRVLRHLVGAAEATYISSAEPVILLADDLTPSDTANLDPDAILGFCTAVGGPTSHTAIMARSLGIPAVVGGGELVTDIDDGTLVILDGYNGKLYLKPGEADVVAARDVQRKLQQAQEQAGAARFEPAVTTDGHHIEVAANINRATAVPQAVEAGAEGVGLMRTEFLFLERDSAPDEDEQFAVYRDMVQALDGRPLIIRTLDIGGDKEVPYLNLPREDNSFLGIRGIRLCLARPDLFLPQLRAIYRAAAYGPLRIMFPMIATLDDFEQARAIAEDVRRELNAPPVPLGMMVEVPSAVALADQFAQIVDFFSIGTNDLTQYTLAMDRLHPQLAKQADALHPAVLRMVHQTVQAAHAHGNWVGVCGGVAGDPKGAALLTGLGVDELSVSVPDIAVVKAAIRARSLAELQALAQKALNCRSAADVRALV